MDMTGLVIRTRKDVAWTWHDWTEVQNKAGKLVRVELLRRECAACAGPLVIAQKLSASVFRRYEQARARPLKPTRYTVNGHTVKYGSLREFEVTVKLSSRYGNLERVRCRSCIDNARWPGRQPADIMELV